MTSSKTKLEENSFECTVCCKTAKESTRFKRVQCANCDYLACNQCQKQFNKLECMNCKSVFPNKYALEIFGTTFVTKTIRQAKIKELMVQQREELETIGPIVEWTRTMREIQKNSRFGVEIDQRSSRRMQQIQQNEMELDEEGMNANTITNANPLMKPRRTIQEDVHSYQCPYANCRGLVFPNKETQSACNICKNNICNECREIARENHECDKNVLETLKDIRENTKPCPSCRTRIHKTMGCAHMNCTYCGIHFNWDTLTVLGNSSNYHYARALIRRIGGTNENECVANLEESRIPEDSMRERIGRPIVETGRGRRIIPPTDAEKQLDLLLDALYYVPRSIRALIIREYTERQITQYTRDKYDDFQVRYSLGEMSEKQWEQNVYKVHTRQVCYNLIANILNIYLINIDGIASELFNTPVEEIAQNVPIFIDRINNLVDMVNETIHEIRVDYDPGSNTEIVIRHVGEDKGHCTKQFVKPKLVVKGKRKINTTATDESATTTASTTKMTPIELYPYQIPHVDKLVSVLEHSHYAVDLSPLGTGKTYSAAKIFQTNPHYKHIITVSPLSVKTKWMDVNEKYKLGCLANLTYNDLAGKRGFNPKCGFLNRNDYIMEVEMQDGQIRPMEKYNFEVTDQFRQYVEEGLLLILDEFQNIKNECAQTDACQAMIRCIHDRFDRIQIQNPDNISRSMPPPDLPQSRAILMSGSPIDKPEQAMRFFRTVGIIRHERIVSGYQRAGINELIDYMIARFPDDSYLQETAGYVSRYDHRVQGLIQNANTSKAYAYEWFVQLIKPELSSTMIMPANPSVRIHKYNGVFEMPNDEFNQARLDEAVNNLRRVVDLNRSLRVRTRYSNSDSMRRIIKTMTMIETAKVSTFERLARKRLSAHPTAKVVIALNYTDSLNDLVGLLSEYNPIVINGKTTLIQRRKLLAEFQKPTAERRLLIANMAVISTGIDLDDKDGNYPRFCYASPNYNTINIYQLGHRFCRGMETKSDSSIYMVYGVNPHERRVLEALMEKGRVMERIGREQLEAGVEFPSNYQSYNEVLTD